MLNEAMSHTRIMATWIRISLGYGPRYIVVAALAVMSEPDISTLHDRVTGSQARRD